MDKIIYKLLYCYDRGHVFNEKLDVFYGDDYRLFKHNATVQREYVFKTNNNQNLLLNKEFVNILKELKIKEPILTKYEHLSCTDRNKIVLESYKGYKLFNIVINYLKLNDKLDYKLDNKLDLNQIIVLNQNKYLGEEYNYLLIFGYFWSLYSEYDFKKIVALLLKVFLLENKDNSY